MLHAFVNFQIFSLKQGFLGGPAEVHLELLPIEPRRHSEGGGGPRGVELHPGDCLGLRKPRELPGLGLV